MKSAYKGGMTLIELIAALVVAGIAIPVLLTMWSTISWQTVRSEGMADSLFYAQGLMEEVTTKLFDENSEDPWSSSLGVDAGENRANATTFNDTDDFVGTTDPRITTPALAYNRWVSVEYVLLNATKSWIPCGAVVCGSVDNCTACNECCYKRITVNVNRTDNIPVNVSLATIVAGY
jgi:prepilin-type N-terminal cleavage/methylation domain-containing protein